MGSFYCTYGNTSAVLPVWGGAEQVRTFPTQSYQILNHLFFKDDSQPQTPLKWLFSANVAFCPLFILNMESAIYTHLHNTSSRISSIFHTTDSTHCLIYTSTHLFNAPSICTPPMYISSLCLYPLSHLHTSVIHTVIDFIECTTYHGWRHTNEIYFEKKEDCTILLKAERLTITQ